MKQNWRELLARPRTWLILVLGSLVAAGAGYGINQALIINRLNQPGAMTNIPEGNNNGDSNGGIVTLEGDVAVGGGPDDNGRSRLTFRLSQGQEEVGTVVPVAVVNGEPLPAEQIQQIIERVPPLAAEGNDQQELNLPDELIPPPLTGDTIDEPFPPPVPRDCAGRGG